MDYIIKKASSLSEQERYERGIQGIPLDWPIEKYTFNTETVPDGFELISENDLQILIQNNQAYYDAWLQSLRPVVTPPSQIQEVSIVDSSYSNPKTDDSRDIVAINRIPAGYTIYPTGQSDAISANGYGVGPEMKFDADNKIQYCQMLGHWYGIGGRVIWEGADLDDSMDAMLIAPATTGLVQEAGDFNKVEVVPGSGLHTIIPAAPGTGSWSLNLSAKNTGTDVLKAVPVPASGNTGFFNYSSSTNTLTANLTQTGGYNLYDFDINLFRFCRKIWGRKQDGAESSLEIADVIGKLLFNTWKIKFTLNTNKTSGIKVGVMMTTAVKKNV